MNAMPVRVVLFHSEGPHFAITLEQNARGQFRTLCGKEVGEWTAEYTRAALDLGQALIHRGLLDSPYV
jgi:hypothetical protein